METPEIFLDNYEVEYCRTVWCWKYGGWASEEYASEALALEALHAQTLSFSTTDELFDPYQAALVSAKVNFGQDEPFDYWLVDNRQVYEPRRGGQLLGELPQFVPLQTAKVLHFTLSQFESMVWLWELEDEEPRTADR